MEINSIWCVKTHIVSECETISDDVRLFDVLENAEKFFNEIVDDERRFANDKEWVIECDDKRNFEAYEEGYFAHNHSCVNLFETKIE